MDSKLFVDEETRLVIHPFAAVQGPVLYGFGHMLGIYRFTAGQVRRLQTGQAQNYALLMVVGLVLTVGSLVLFR